MKFEVNGRTIPTNTPYHTTINGKGVNLTHVSCNGKTVWKYIPTTGGGHPGGGTPPDHGGGSKGHWVTIPYSDANNVRVRTHYMDGVPGQIDTVSTLNGGHYPGGGGAGYHAGALHHTVGYPPKAHGPDTVKQYFYIMTWVPADEPYEPDEVDIDIDNIILKDGIEDVIDSETPEIE